MPKIVSVKTMLIEELRDLFDAEQRLTKAIPQLVDEATSEELSRRPQRIAIGQRCMSLEAHAITITAERTHIASRLGYIVPLQHLS